MIAVDKVIHAGSWIRLLRNFFPFAYYSHEQYWWWIAKNDKMILLALKSPYRFTVRQINRNWYFPSQIYIGAHAIFPFFSFMILFSSNENEFRICAKSSQFPSTKQTHTHRCLASARPTPTCVCKQPKTHTHKIQVDQPQAWRRTHAIDITAMNACSNIFELRNRWIFKIASFS